MTAKRKKGFLTLAALAAAAVVAILCASALAVSNATAFSLAAEKQAFVQRLWVDSVGDAFLRSDECAYSPEFGFGSDKYEIKIGGDSLVIKTKGGETLLCVIKDGQQIKKWSYGE